MKIYLFHPETGVYLGEDFADEGGSGYVLPTDATTIAPPQVGPGQFPVFDAGEDRWDVRSHPGR